MPAPRGIHSPHWTCKRLFTVWRHLCSYVHILISLGKTPPSSQAPALTEEEIGARKAIAQLVIRRGPEFSLPGVGKCAPGLLPWVWDAHRAPTGLQAGTVGGLGGGVCPLGSQGRGSVWTADRAGRQGPVVTPRAARGLQEPPAGRVCALWEEGQGWPAVGGRPDPALLPKGHRQSRPKAPCEEAPGGRVLQ